MNNQEMDINETIDNEKAIQIIVPIKTPFEPISSFTAKYIESGIFIMAIEIAMNI